MGRFDNLEISVNKQEAESGNPLQQGPLGPVYDEKQFMASAEEKFWTGDFESALIYYSKALRENNAIEQAWLGQVRCLIQMKEYKEALIWVDKALDKFPESAELLAAKSIVLSRTGSRKTAMEFSDATLKMKRDSEFIWLSRGDVLLDANTKNAKFCLDKALEYGKNDWRTFTAVGNVYQDHERYRNALTYYLKAAEINESNPWLWVLIGVCRGEIGFENAHQAFRTALDLRPDWELPQKYIKKYSETAVKRFFRRVFRK